MTLRVTHRLESLLRPDEKLASAISYSVDSLPTIARSPGWGRARGARGHGHVARGIGRGRSQLRRVRERWAGRRNQTW